jgi:hypothetical protein
MLLDAPANRQAEAALIGSLLIDPAALERVAAVVSAEDFTRPAGRLTYGAMLALRQRGIAVDFVTVCAELQRTGGLAAIGGDGTLIYCVNAAPTSLHALDYARIVADLGRERRGEPEPLPEPEIETPRRRLTERLGLADDERSTPAPRAYHQGEIDPDDVF